jgi:hypothetical protein
MRFRCMNCHTEGTPQNDKLVKEHGEHVAWFKKEGPMATLDYLLSSKLLDLEHPEKSLLLTKPLNTVKHGGGIKFVVGDQGYKAFRTWIDDVASIKGGKYLAAKNLPVSEGALKQFGSEAWLKLANTPDAWGDKLLQVNVHAWDERAKAWEKEPVATSDRVVWGKGKQWQHTLTLLAAPGSARARSWTAQKAALPAGKYLVKVFVDRAEKAKADWKAVPGADQFVGQVEIQSRWREGYGAMTEVDAGKVQK